MGGKITGFDQLDRRISGIADRAGDVSSRGKAIHREIVAAYRRQKRKIPRRSGDLEKALTRLNGPGQFFTVQATTFEFGTTLRQASFVKLPTIRMDQTKIVQTIKAWVIDGN